jgi:hypothetical protein
MFQRLSEALPLSEASLLAMRPALNAPVLNVGFLPVGPARAAIVAFAEEWGGIGFALGIRSNEGGQVAVFRNQVSIEPDVVIPDALEPVLAEAERMGFLFDEDIVDSKLGGQGREAALALWGRLMGEIEMPPSTRAVPPVPAATESIAKMSNPLMPFDSFEELVLEEVALGTTPEISLEREASQLPAFPAEKRRLPKMKAPAPGSRDLTELPPSLPASAVQKTAALPGKRAPFKPSGSPKQKLSRFRHVDEYVAADSEGATGFNEMTEKASPLGRIPIVRIRRERDGKKRIPYLARLLSSF